MSTVPSKRQRVNTNGDSSTSLSENEYREIIEIFDEETLRDLLLVAAKSSPSVAKAITTRHDAILKAESTRIIDFDHYSKNAWHELQQGQRLSGSRQYQLGLDVSVTLGDMIAEIRQQTPAHSSFGTKKSALETLRKIGKSLVLRNYDTFGSEVVNSLYTDGDPQEKVMLEIVDEMTEDEKGRMRGNREWVEKVEELIELGQQYDMYDSLTGMLGNLGVGGHRTNTTRVQAQKRQKRKAPRIDLCHGCGCGNDRCSSCWGDENNEDEEDDEDDEDSEDSEDSEDDEDDEDES